MSYIGRHWRGEFPLPQSYWLNGVVILMPFNIYFRALEVAFQQDPPQSPSIFVEAFLLPFLVMIPVVIWSGVGIWRSAGHRIADGRKGWAWVARIVVLINLLTLIGALVTTSRSSYSVYEAWRVESRSTYSVKAKDNYVIFHGTITDAAATELIAKLNNDKVKRLVLNASNGGFMRPTMRIAKVIKERKLFVVAMAQCESACTVLLAAGHTRAMLPDTMMGFHRGTLVGLSDTAVPEDEQGDRYYADAGMSADLIARIRSHAGPDDLYDPPLTDLIDDGFITEIFDQASHLYLPAHEWCVAHAAVCARTGRQNWQAAHGPHPQNPQ
ncbi:MAG TPA: ATP-dependent Clp protease proteolytic subunit [Rhizomicrobium sp.]|nr:ATP-dependent Clp protease proteolytic subunit [Rhizomicrobium sp.]